MTAPASMAEAFGARREDDGPAAAPDLARWLGLAAAPTFAAMALLTGLRDAGPMDALCSVGHGSPLGGMVPMYLLMSAFHAAPWLKLISSRRCPPRAALPTSGSGQIRNATAQLRRPLA